MNNEKKVTASNKKQVPLTVEQIRSKRSELKSEIKNILNSKKANGKISQSRMLLIETQDLIKEMVDNNISYEKISQSLEKIFNFKITSQTVRRFALETLGVPKKFPNRKIKTLDSTSNPTNNDTSNKTTNKHKR